ncbi:threonine--tRNA ligase [Nanoarchaeota archaeon]
MRILTLHVDWIKFKALKKALKSIPDLKDKTEHELKESLVILTAVEKADEKNLDQSIKDLVKNVQDVAKQVGAKTIVLYPYAHLSSDLASPASATKVLDSAANLLKKEKFKVDQAPFGYYKEFSLKCKGHPLAELSRSIKPGESAKEEESEALKAEKKLKSHWFIMDTKGKLHPVDKFNYSNYDNLKKFAKYEKEKVRAVTEEPAHVKLMRKHELVDYEPATDSGNFRYYPKGRLIKALLEEYVTKRVVAYGGQEVETPLMYDNAHPALAEYLQRFPARRYEIESDKRKFFLRFSACFGQFLMAHNATISYKALPFRIYEMTRYSFRREQSGELTGLRRLRAFTMPDVHAMCADIKQAMKEYQTRFKLSLDIQEKIGFNKEDFELAVRVTKDFYEKNKEFVEWLVKTYGKPALIEMWDERKFYFILKYELNFVDNNSKASALTTDQVDVENAERYGINYVSKDGSKKKPIILHCSPSGAIERVIYALLERAEKESKQGKNPVWPLWLSPTQVRICPVNDSYVGASEKLADEFEKNNIRVDIDDRVETIGKKIMNSELDWVPYTLVIGEKEAKSKELTVRIRETKKQTKMKTEKFIKEIKSKTEGMPFRMLPIPRLLTKRITFVG